MSNTLKHKNKGRYNRFKKVASNERRRLQNKLVKKGWDWISAWDLTRLDGVVNDPWDEMTHDQRKAIVNYSKNPSDWNREFNRAPKRCQDRDMLKKTYIGDEQDLVFTDDNKPNKYYW